MGYRHQRKVYNLKFEDHPGLEVIARSVSVADFLTIMKLADQMTTAPDESQIEVMFGWFTRHLTGWNLEEEDGKPVPQTVKGLMAEDLEFALMIVMSWVGALKPKVAAPLVEASAGTARDPVEASIPMTPPTGTQ
jgi:hypothetical protein